MKISLVNEELPCSEKGCKEKAVSLSSFCWKHIPDKVQYTEELKKYLSKTGDGKKFILRKIILRDFDLMKVDLRYSDLSQADFTNSNLSYSDISEANLVGCIMEGCDLTSVNLKNSDLTRANLKNTRLWHSDLTFSNLNEAYLTGADMWKCQMFSARLWHTELRNVKFLTKQNFSRKIFGMLVCEKIDERGILSAEESYRTLKQYFSRNGLYGDTSWASFKEKTMEKLWLRKTSKLAYIPTALMGFLSGYGEKPSRVILASSLIVLIYSTIYYRINSITCSFSSVQNFSFWDYAYYSIVTFTTLGYGDLVPKANVGYRLLAGSEAFIGAFMIGLFVFTLSRKYSAR